MNRDDFSLLAMGFTSQRDTLTTLGDEKYLQSIMDETLPLNMLPSALRYGLDRLQRIAGNSKFLPISTPQPRRFAAWK